MVPRGDVQACKKVGDETSTQLGCWLVSIIQYGSLPLAPYGDGDKSVRMYQVRVWKVSLLKWVHGLWSSRRT